MHTAPEGGSSYVAPVDVTTFEGQRVHFSTRAPTSPPPSLTRACGLAGSPCERFPIQLQCACTVLLRWGLWGVGRWGVGPRLDFWPHQLALWMWAIECSARCPYLLPPHGKLHPLCVLGLHCGTCSGSRVDCGPGGASGVGRDGPWPLPAAAWSAAWRHALPFCVCE